RGAGGVAQRRAPGGGRHPAPARRSPHGGRLRDRGGVSGEVRPGALRRLVGWLRRDLAREPSALPAPEAPPEPAVLGAKEELWLGQLAEDVGEGRRLDAIGGEEFWSHIDSLWSSGHERMALAWLEKGLAIPAGDGERRVAAPRP